MAQEQQVVKNLPRIKLVPSPPSSFKSFAKIYIFLWIDYYKHLFDWRTVIIHTVVLFWTARATLEILIPDFVKQTSEEKPAEGDELEVLLFFLNEDILSLVRVLFFVVLKAVYFLLPSHSILIISVLKIQGCTSWQTKQVYSHHIRSFMSALRGMLWCSFPFDYTQFNITRNTSVNTTRQSVGPYYHHVCLKSNWRSVTVCSIETMAWVTPASSLRWFQERTRRANTSWHVGSTLYAAGVSIHA